MSSHVIVCEDLHELFIVCDVSPISLVSFDISLNKPLHSSKALILSWSLLHELVASHGKGVTLRDDVLKFRGLSRLWRLWLLWEPIAWKMVWSYLRFMKMILACSNERDIGRILWWSRVRTLGVRLMKTDGENSIWQAHVNLAYWVKTFT